MPKTVITLYGRDYALACEDGQEARLQEIGKLVDRKMRQVAGGAGNSTEQRLLLLACLSLADELIDARLKIETEEKTEEEILVNAVGILREKIGHLVRVAGNA